MPKTIEELHHKKLTWVNIKNNGKKEIEYVDKNYNFHTLDVQDCLPPLQRPKFVQREDYLFLIFLFPVYNSKTRKISLAEIDFFVTPNTLITVHDNTLEPVKKLFAKMKENRDGEKSGVMKQNPLFIVYEILDRLYDYCFPMLVHINEDLDEIDDNLFKIYNQSMVKEISQVKRNIVNFRRALQPHKNIIKKIILGYQTIFPDKRMALYFEHLKETTKDIWDLLESYNETVNAMSEAYDSLMSFRINNIIKTLTIFSVIVFPLTLLAAIFGMNTLGSMPFISHPLGFWIIIGIMLLGTLGMIIYFRKKHWI